MNSRMSEASAKVVKAEANVVGVAEEANGGGGIPTEVKNLEAKGEDEKEVEEVKEIGKGAEKDEGTTKSGEEIEGGREIQG
ncbi:hypothetical protein VNO78_23884 [Psophocarpus tetragonolobus]|uniref:Uncharacterized protein n=1 Tax=Psophocarpus tetragonolobus TaxID=3891 RepID=A0AAN9XEA0_PSOTE